MAPELTEGLEDVPKGVWSPLPQLVLSLSMLPLGNGSLALFAGAGVKVWLEIGVQVRRLRYLPPRRVGCLC